MPNFRISDEIDASSVFDEIHAQSIVLPNVTLDALDDEGHRSVASDLTAVSPRDGQELNVRVSGITKDMLTGFMVGPSRLCGSERFNLIWDEQCGYKSGSKRIGPENLAAIGIFSVRKLGEMDGCSRDTELVESSVTSDGEDIVDDFEKE
jgi:hypothetical protein